MSKVFDMDEQQFLEWKATRPPFIQEMISKYPPDRLYKLTTTGQLVTLISYAEDGTVRILVSQKWNGPFVMEREVFGIDPKELVEFDLNESSN